MNEKTESAYKAISNIKKTKQLKSQRNILTILTYKKTT